jgi:hypothetical protein
MSNLAMMFALLGYMAIVANFVILLKIVQILKKQLKK